MVLNSGSAALIAQTDSEGVFRTEAATRLFDETRAEITVAVAESPAVDNSPDQTPDDRMAGQWGLLSLVVAVIAPCPARPSQAFSRFPSPTRADPGERHQNKVTLHFASEFCAWLSC